MRTLSLVLALVAVPAAASPLDPALLDDAMAKAHRQAESCIVQTGVVGGEVSVRAIVGPDGSVADAQITGGTLADPDALGCVVQAVKQQHIDRPEGGGFTPTSRTFVFWNPPESAKPVKDRKARKVVESGLPTLEGCMENAPETLTVHLLVARRRVHPVTGALPVEWGRCVSKAFRDERVGGVGSVRAEVRFDAEGQAEIVDVRSGGMAVGAVRVADGG